MIAIAKLTIGEAARRKILWVLVILAVLAVTLVAWGVGRLVEAGRESGADELEIRLAVSQVLIFIAFQFGFVQAMTAAFLGSPAIASDLESGVALAVLARPIRRSSYLLGRWLGLAIVLSAYGAGSSLFAILVVGGVSGYTPPSIVTPVAFLVAEGLVVLTLTMLLSTRLPPIGGGAIAVVAFGLAWMAGTIERVGIAISARNPDVDLGFVGDIGRILLPTDGLWRGVIYGLEPPIVIAAARDQPLAEANPFFALSPPPVAFLAWVVVWVVIVLSLAALSLRRREP
ncbi:MAG TPA: ABC transporter permease subunit [Candidatus Limnocylindrales bacterium]|jgi:ABC-type transport system involved in multi-copper enzyme maturation permease subunit|nr:ABC transporter permease subunit [Candidatus Limnocylindrales bacterium]